MNQAVVMVEEQSLEEVTRVLVGRLGLQQQIKIVPHDGKNDLEKSFPRKLSNWRSPGRTRFVICRDNDGNDCTELKNKLRNLLPPNPPHEFKFRLVMNELEAWYLADLRALHSAGLISQVNIEQNQNKKKFRSPESLLNAKQEFLRLVKTSGQITLARRIAPHLDLRNDRCCSFKHFISAIRWAVE